MTYHDISVDFVKLCQEYKYLNVLKNNNTNRKSVVLPGRNLYT